MKTRAKAIGARLSTCAHCHKLHKFCKCTDEEKGKPVCPICLSSADSGKHFPEVDCARGGAE